MRKQCYLFLLVFVCQCCLACTEENVIPQHVVDPSPMYAKVRFQEPVQLTEFMPQLGDDGVQPVLFQSEFDVAGTTITDFLPIDTNYPLPDLIASFQEHRRSSFEDFIKNFQVASEDERLEQKPSLEDYENALKGYDTDWQDVKVISITLRSHDALILKDVLGLLPQHTEYFMNPWDTVKSNVDLKPFSSQVSGTSCKGELEMSYFE